MLKQDNKDFLIFFIVQTHQTRGLKRKTHNFLGFAKATAQWLVDNRKIKGVGTDARSYDVGPSTNFPAHQIFLGNNIYCLESVANIEKLPVKGATVYVMPMKVKGGSGGPTRVVAQTESAGRGFHPTSSIFVIFLSILLSSMVFDYE